MLFITHDLGIVAELATEVVVLHAGQVVESGPVEALFARPLHPYTRGLLASGPRAGASRLGGRPGRLPGIGGTPPDLAALPAGCRFADRCALRAERPEGHERCVTDPPPLVQALDGRQHRCHYGDVAR
jgi:oligopeptide/dipeptide ABC transporter ATP-binding protein